MNSSVKKELQRKIQKSIIALRAEIIDLEELTKPISPENSLGRITRMDAINNKSVVEASLRNRRRKLGKMRVALTNIKDEAFGRCNRCKKDINPERLLIMPESEMCVTCASKGR